MKNLILLASLFIAGCANIAVQPQPAPPIEYETGFTFEVPCATHGSHINTVVSTEVVRIYIIDVDGGKEQITATTESITQVLRHIETLQQVPEVTVDVSEK